MPTAKKVEQAEYPLPTDEYFPAELLSVEEKVITYFKKDASTGLRTNEQDQFSKWKWKFAIVGGEYSGTWAYGETPAEYTTREDNQVRLWAETLLGRELAIGEELDTDQLLGLPCMISVRHEEPRAKKDGGWFYGCPVDEVLPRKAGPTSFTAVEPPY